MPGCMNKVSLRNNRREGDIRMVIISLDRPLASWRFEVRSPHEIGN